jgi:thioredoxin 1
MYASSNIHDVTDTSDFEKSVIEQSKKVPVIVDFTAKWCGPCKMLAKCYDEIADKYAGEPVKYIKFDIEINREIAKKYGIRSLPSVKVFKNGELVPGVGLTGYKDATQALEDITKSAI